MKAAPLRIYNPPYRQIIHFKYLITSVGSFSSVLYHPLAHLTAFGTPCCKLMTLGFLTPDPHLNRNQPRVQQRKHPTVGGFGQFLSPGPLATLPARWQRDRERQREGYMPCSDCGLLLLPAARLAIAMVLYCCMQVYAANV